MWPKKKKNQAWPMILEQRGNTFCLQASLSIVNVMKSEENNKNPHLENSGPFQAFITSK